MRPSHAIVTGGGSGIGAAIVTGLLRQPTPSGAEQAKVFVTGQKPFADTALARTLQETFGAGDLDARVRYSAGDTGDKAVVSAQLREAMEFFGGPPRALFINAGIGGGRFSLESFDVDRFDAMMRTNVRGVFLWLRTALPVLKPLDCTSQIVVTSSVMGSRPVPQAGPYCASKAAVNSLVLSLRAELKTSHPLVKVGLVCPAAVATPWWEERGRGFAEGATLPPNMLTPEAVAAACLSLMQQDVSSNIEQIQMDAAG